MSDASTTVPANASDGRHNRSAKNYLIDRRFQLKYSGFLAGIALLLSGALGVILWSTSSQVIEESRQTVRQGQETVDRGKEVLTQSRRVSQVVAMNIAKGYKDDPELAKTFAESSASDDASLLAQQAKLEEDAGQLRQRALDLERQQKTLLAALVIALSLLVLGVGFAGIVFTHKVSGPIFKMKRLLRQVGEGKFVVRERLRKGDELQHFFETFEKMVEDLRGHQEREIGQVAAILDRLDRGVATGRGAGELDEEGLVLLRELHREMTAALEV